MIETSPGSITFPGRKPIFDTHHYGLIPFTDVIVKSSNVGAIKVGLQLGPERLGDYITRLRLRPDARPRFPRRDGGHRLEPRAAERQRARVGVDGLPGRRDAAADGDRGQHRRQRRAPLQPRVVRAFIKDGRRLEVPHKEVRQAISADTAATLTTIMEQVVERGTARAAQIDGYTIAGKTGPPPSS